MVLPGEHLSNRAVASRDGVVSGMNGGYNRDDTSIQSGPTVQDFGLQRVVLRVSH
jgi:hypothetical protein